MNILAESKFICLEAMEGYCCGANPAKTSKLKTNTKTRRWICSGVGLHFVQKRGKFNVYRRKTLKIYQDNDPMHKAYKERSWLLHNCPKVIEPLSSRLT